MMAIQRCSKQRAVGLQKSIALTFFSAIALALFTNILPVLPAETPLMRNSKRTFSDWCRDRATLSPETKHSETIRSRISNR
jgi:internalin A